MTQTLAIFYDAYLDLSARRLFWITVALSGVAIGAFGLLGVNGNELTYLMWHQSTAPLDARATYLWFFSKAVIGFWLTWIAIVLALMTTAGIFPDLLSSGTIDLYLARPMSRFRFFLTKYLSGLIFAGLQVTVFTVGSFFVLGLRIGEWRPALFLAIPLVVCAYSYLFAVCVLFGVWTRSTLSALLFTLLIGGIYTALFWTDQNIFDESVRSGQLTRYHSTDSESYNGFDKFSHVIQEALAPLPKIFPTTRLLDRWMRNKSDVLTSLGLDNSDNTGAYQMWRRPDVSDADREEAYGRATGGDPLHTLGSSLIFEAIVFGLAAWIFCRRDY